MHQYFLVIAFPLCHRVLLGCRKEGIQQIDGGQQKALAKRANLEASTESPLGKSRVLFHVRFFITTLVMRYVCGDLYLFETGACLLLLLNLFQNLSLDYCALPTFSRRRDSRIVRITLVLPQIQNYSKIFDFDLVTGARGLISHDMTTIMNYFADRFNILLLLTIIGALFSIAWVLTCVYSSPLSRHNKQSGSEKQWWKTLPVPRFGASELSAGRGVYERSELPVSEKAVVGRPGRERVRDDVVDGKGDSAEDFEGRSCLEISMVFWVMFSILVDEDWSCGS